MPKQDFNSYFHYHTRDLNRNFDTPTMELFKSAYSLNVGLASFFSSFMSYEELYSKLNTQIRKLYKIQFHNIGNNPYKRFYQSDLHCDWLKVEHYLISHFYSIQKDSTYVSNKTIAINIGWLSSDESNKLVITKASRRVTDALNILKTTRNTISVKHCHRHGKNGSYHLITANWFEIIPLYQSYDPDKAISIRQRKGIRYRIISLLFKSAKSFSNGLRKLMKMQKDKYLKAITTMDLDNFAESRFWYQYLLDKFKKRNDVDLGFEHLTIDTVIPNYTHPELTLTVKNEYWYDVIKASISLFLDKELKDNYNINLNLVAQF